MSESISRRAALKRLTLASGVLALPRAAATQAKTPIAVYKDPSCGCCGAWVDYLKANGFAPTVTDTTAMSVVKTRYHVPKALEACHTGIVDGLVMEGHIPAADIRRFMAEKPKGMIGLSIPGMPASAPGMDGKPFQPYSVLAFDARGTTSVYAKHDRI